MAYVAMPNRSTGYLVTASDWNQLLANDQADPAAIATTKGDVFAASAANTIARIGTPGSFGIPTWNDNASAGLSAGAGGLCLATAGYKAVSTTTETDMITFTVPANYMGTNGVIVIEYFLSPHTASNTHVVKLYIGATSITFTNSDNSTFNGLRGTGVVANLGATNSQRLSLWENAINTTGAVFGPAGGTTGTAAIDTTANAVVKLTLQDTETSGGMAILFATMTLYADNSASL